MTPAHTMAKCLWRHGLRAVEPCSQAPGPPRTDHIAPFVWSGRRASEAPYRRSGRARGPNIAGDSAVGPETEVSVRRERHQREIAVQGLYPLERLGVAGARADDTALVLSDVDATERYLAPLRSATRPRPRSTTVNRACPSRTNRVSRRQHVSIIVRLMGIG